jgi:hypothetical protein
LTDLKPGWADMLKHRSVDDKIGVAVDCDLAPVGELAVVAELVREGIMQWIDRAWLGHLAVQNADGSHRRRGVNCDIYKLTEKGIALCEQHGIKQT